MTKQEGLQFLQLYQPMPDDDELTEELIGKYDDVRNYFIDHPEEAAIPLFLNSFGEGDGFGVYQLVEDVLLQFPEEKVVGHLRHGLSNPKRSIRYWNAEIAANFPAVELIPALVALLGEDDENLNAAAVIALGQIKDNEAIAALKSTLNRGISGHLTSLIQEQLNG